MVSLLKTHLSKARDQAHLSVTTSNRRLWLVSSAPSPHQDVLSLTRVVFPVSSLPNTGFLKETVHWRRPRNEWSAWRGQGERTLRWASANVSGTEGQVSVWPPVGCVKPTPWWQAGATARRCFREEEAHQAPHPHSMWPTVFSLLLVTFAHSY